MSLRVLATSATWSLAAHLLSRGSLVIASVLLARNLETAGFAAYSYFQMTVSMLAAYSALGMGVTASKFFAEIDYVSEDRLPPIGTLWILSVLAGIILALAITALPANWVNGELEISRHLIALGIFAMALGIVPAGGILGLERYPEATIISAIAASILIVGAYVAGTIGSPVGAMWVFILGSLVQATGNTIIIIRKIGTKKLIGSTCFRKKELRKIAEFAGPMTAVTLLSASGGWLVGRIILMGPSSENGFSLYAIGLQWFSLALLLPGMITRVIFPRLIRERLHPSSGTGYRESALVRRGIYMTLISALVTCTIAAMLSPWLWPLYNIKYSHGAWLITGFMFAALPAAPANTLGNAILANNGQIEWLLITSVWFLSLVTLTITSISLGAWSGVIGYGFAYLIMILLVVKVTRRRNLI